MVYLYFAFVISLPKTNCVLFASRLRVVSNFGDGDCGAGEIHTRARAKLREDATRGERQKFRARACISPVPQAIAKIRDYLQSSLRRGLVGEFTPFGQARVQRD